MMDIANLDWNQIWMDQMTRAQESCPQMNRDDYWADEESARQYREARYADGGLRIARTLDGLPLNEWSRVLDIGSGPGVFSIPLAKRVTQVTAVEPSKGMMTVMESIRQKEGIGNLVCLAKTWDEVDPRADLDPPYDLVMAYMSLCMFDMRAAIEKMEQVAAGRIYLVWFAGQTGWDRQAEILWPRLHQAEYHPGPGCDILFNLLYQMGIHPQIRSTKLDFGERFSSMENAMDFFEQRYGLTTENQRQVLSEYLRQATVEEDGAVILPYSATYMEFWWDKREPDWLITDNISNLEAGS